MLLLSGTGRSVRALHHQGAGRFLPTPSPSHASVGAPRHAGCAAAHPRLNFCIPRRLPTDPPAPVASRPHSSAPTHTIPACGVSSAWFSREYWLRLQFPSSAVPDRSTSHKSTAHLLLAPATATSRGLRQDLLHSFPWLGGSLGKSGPQLAALFPR